MDELILAQELHESARESVEKGATVAAQNGDESRRFIEWRELSREARDGRLIQARYLLERFVIIPRDVADDPLRLALK